MDILSTLFQMPSPESGCFDNSHSTGVLSTRPTSVADWFIEGSAMCYHVCVILHIKDSLLSVPLADFCLYLYSLHVLNREVYMIQLMIHLAYAVLEV